VGCDGTLNLSAQEAEAVGLCELEASLVYTKSSRPSQGYVERAESLCDCSVIGIIWVLTNVFSVASEVMYDLSYTSSIVCVL